jgi:hypothetical protein
MTQVLETRANQDCFISKKNSSLKFEAFPLETANQQIQFDRVRDIFQRDAMQHGL